MFKGLIAIWAMLPILPKIWALIQAWIDAYQAYQKKKQLAAFDQAAQQAQATGDTANVEALFNGTPPHGVSDGAPKA